MEKVLIAVDDTKGSKNVLDVFSNLVKPPKEVLILHVQKLEGKSLMKYLSTDHLTVACDERGKSITSLELSERFISFAIDCMSSEDNPSASGKMARGLPVKGRSVKTSAWMKWKSFMEGKYYLKP